MGQDWTVVNLDRREYRYMGKIIEGWFDDPNMTLTWALSMPLEKEKLDPKGSLTKIRLPVMDRRSLGMLGKLPLEMIRAVLSNIAEVVDVAALSLANRSLVDLGLERVRDMLYERFRCQSWAGDRLVCIGTRLEGIPKEVLTEAEFAEFSKGEEPFAYQVQASRFVALDTENSEAEERMDAHMTCPFIEVDHDGALRRRFTDMSPRRKWLEWKMRRITEDEEKVLDTMGELRGWALRKGVWVACNLSKKQYVHQDAAKAINEKKGSPFGRGWLGYCSLGFLTGVLVCWPQEGDDEVERGPWAGDRVAIMTFDKMKESEGEWVDISKEAIRKTWAMTCLR
ncbi:hypothetical protein OF83DRAFT_644002 [Amylostereum chailletii]|nr:hypothetical protein OF83DRAFT_644002 [Amylostereum chailletii]